MSLLESLDCDTKPAQQAIDCLIEKLIPYKTDYSLEMVVSCIAAVRKE